MINSILQTVAIQPQAIESQHTFVVLNEILRCNSQVPKTDQSTHRNLHPDRAQPSDRDRTERPLDQPRNRRQAENPIHVPPNSMPFCKVNEVVGLMF